MYEFMIDTFLPSLKMVFAWIKEMFVSFSDKMQEGNTVSVVFMFSILGTVISGLAYIFMNFLEHSINTDYSEPYIPLGTRFRGDIRTRHFKGKHNKSVNGKRLVYNESDGSISYYDDSEYVVLFDSDKPFGFNAHGKSVRQKPKNSREFKKKFGNAPHVIISNNFGSFMVPKGNSKEAKRYRRRLRRKYGLSVSKDDLT